MGFALLGVMAMQLYFLRQSYQLQSELFDRSVNEALSNVVTKISKHDALNFLNVKAQGGNSYQRVWSAGNNKLAPDGSITDNNPIAKVNSTSKKRLTGHEKRIAIWRDSLRRMIMHKKMDDEIAGLMQGGTINLQLRYEEYTDEFGDVQYMGHLFNFAKARDCFQSK